MSRADRWREQATAAYLEAAQEAFGSELQGETITQIAHGFTRPAWAHPLILNEAIGIAVSRYWIVAETPTRLLRVRTRIAWGGVRKAAKLYGTPAESWDLGQVELLDVGKIFKLRSLKLRMAGGTPVRIHFSAIWAPTVEAIAGDLRAARGGPPTMG